MQTPTYNNPNSNDQHRPFKEQAREQAKRALSKTQERADEAMHKAGDEVKNRVTEGKHNAAHSLTNLASAIRTAGDELREKEGPQMGDMVQSAADAVENVSGYLERTSVDEFVQETERFARRSPGLFLGGALALGFLAGRFFSSTKSDRDYGYQRALPEDTTVRSATREFATSEPASGPSATGYGYGTTAAGNTGFATGSSVGGMTPDTERS